MDELANRSRRYTLEKLLFDNARLPNLKRFSKMPWRYVYRF